MRSLTELMNSERGIDFLQRRGIFADPRAFAGSLKKPARSALADTLGLPADGNLVYVGQQACADYEASTARKFEASSDLQVQQGVTVAMLWHDMYQGDAERFGTRILLPGGNKVRGLWLVHRSVGAWEPRLIPIDRPRIQEALAEIEQWVAHAPNIDRAAARARLRHLGTVMLDERLETLAHASGAMADCLVREQIGCNAPSTFASTMAAGGLFTDTLNTVLANIEAVVNVFNAAIDRLIADDIDPQVKPVPENYLPLHYSCPSDGTRLRLSHERSGGDHYAVATCRCQSQYRFHLGSGSLSLGEIEATGRWSLDVSMPVYHNDIASGWVAGRSTALYGLVFNEVIEKVLGRTPIPALVPARLADEPTEEKATRTLLFDYLTAPPPSGAAAVRQ